MMNNRPDPIGVFDSGIGGLTVFRALMEELPLRTLSILEILPGYLME